MIVLALVVAAALTAGRVAQRRRPDAMPGFTRRILAFMVTVLVPVVVFFNVIRLEFDRDVAGGILLGWVALGLTGSLAYTIATRVLHLDRPQTGSLINTGLQPNSGYLGLPMAAVLLGPHAITVGVGYDALVSAPVLLLGVFGVGAAFGTHAGEGAAQRTRAFFVRNPPLVAAALGLVAPDALAPDVAIDVTHVIIYAQLPLGLFAIGAVLTAEGLRIPPRPTRRLAVGLALRCLVAPALLLGLAAPLIDLPDAYLVLAAMGPGLTGVAVAQRFGLDVPFQAAAIAWGTVLVVAAGVVLQLAA